MYFKKGKEGISVTGHEDQNGTVLRAVYGYLLFAEMTNPLDKEMKKTRSHMTRV